MDLGDKITDEQRNILSERGYNPNYFKLLTAEQIENDLEISGVGMDLLIDFTNRIVVSPEGFKVGKFTYYDINDKNKVNANNKKNSGNVDFNYTVEKYGDNYRMKFEPINVGDVKDGMFKYKKSTLNYWTVINNNQLIVSQLTDYYVTYMDANNNSITKLIRLSLNSNNEVVADVIESK